MDKNILITEKPSVAMQMAKALKINTTRKDGYLESSEWIVTWCVGHLVTCLLYTSTAREEERRSKS